MDCNTAKVMFLLMMPWTYFFKNKHSIHKNAFCFLFFFKAGRGSGVEKGGTGQEGENWAGKNRGKRGRKQEKNGKNNRKEPGSIYGKNTGYFPERKRDPFTGKVRDISLKENGIRLREKYGKEYRKRFTGFVTGKTGGKKKFRFGTNPVKIFLQNYLQDTEKSFTGCCRFFNGWALFRIVVFLLRFTGIQN